MNITEEHKKTTTNMLKVNKLPVGTTEDSLEFFFENTRKFGGGDVERVEYDEDASSAIITFVEDDGKCILIGCRRSGLYINIFLNLSLRTTN